MKKMVNVKLWDPLTSSPTYSSSQNSSLSLPPPASHHPPRPPLRNPGQSQLYSRTTKSPILPCASALSPCASPPRAAPTSCASSAHDSGVASPPSPHASCFATRTRPCGRPLVLDINVIHQTSSRDVTWERPQGLRQDT